LSREEGGEICKFIKEQLRKRYIRPSKLPQTALVFFVGKNDGKNRIVHDFFFLNQQFITWSMRADHGNYFVTTYMKTEATG